MTYAEVLIQKGKRGAAAYVQAECNSAKSEPSKSPQHLNALLDHLLHPEKPIDDQDTIDWCQWLVGGGRSYEDFAANVREYDNTAMCGLVWTADFVAYRCRTCGISQCMSLCAECFKCGNHEGHDYNMFKSQAGGACDCGDSSVMKESGFCSQHHGSRAPPRPCSPPPDLMCVAENMIPRIILRLLQHLRVNTVPSDQQATSAQSLEKYEKVIEESNRFLKLLHDFSSLGAAMRTVMTRALVDMQSYARLTNVNEDSEYAGFMRKSKELYEDALGSLPNPDTPAEFQDCTALTAQLQHRTFLEELVFWTVKYEFPEKLVCLLLKMLPDTEYKEAFTRSFVLHYSRVSMMLVQSSNSDKLSNRVVHVSVQLFSNEELALAMTESLSLLHIMVSSLKNMMSAVLVPSEMNAFASSHLVVDCSKHVMRDHCYWPLVSDLNNVLSHPPIAFRFMSDNTLLTMWFDFLKMFQGMNLNIRVHGSHIEFEPNTYYASFSGELEASASPMWALVSHVKANSSREFSENIIRHCLAAIREWMNTIQFNDPSLIDPKKASFHIPLHRYFSVFLRQAVKAQGFKLQELLPDSEMLTLMMQHPLRVQTAFYEIMSGLWVRNGLQIKGQAMTYIQCHFCKSMVDADLFLLQICATQLPTGQFISTVLEKFQIENWLSLSYLRPNHLKPARVYRDQEQELQMIESCLIFLVSILSLRTNLGLNEEILARLEMVSLLCMGDKTHSMLYEHMPEKCGTSVQLELFDKVLSEVAQFSEPRFEASGNMQQGMYLPKPKVWEDLYDPVYVLLRAVHRREFQTSIERFNTFARERFSGDADRLRTVTSPWPPWRLPAHVDEGFEDPRKMLHSKNMHGLIFNLLHQAVHGKIINDFVTSLAVHLLELAVTYPQKEGFSGKELAVSKPWVMANEPIDLKYDTWFPTDWLSANLRHVVSVIFSQPSGSRHPGGMSEGAADDENAVTQSMEVDQVSDVSDAEELTEAYHVETPSSLTMEENIVPVFPSNDGVSRMEGVSYQQPLAIAGPSAVGGYEMVPATGLSQLIAEHGSAAVNSVEHTNLEALTSETSSSRPCLIPGPPNRMVGGRTNAKASVTIVNESMISLMLQLHSKYSGRNDSYVPWCKRKEGFSTTKEYRESRIGDACFYIEKVLDRIYELDESCAQSVDNCRKQLWPHYHAQEAKNDEEQEKREAEAKKKRAKERQRQMMEQLAAQRRRFMQASAMETDAMSADDASEDSHLPASGAGNGTKMSTDADDASSDYGNLDGGAASAVVRKEYTCCHCLAQGPASEDRPIGLVTWIQSTSVLAHRHHKSGHLSLPVREEEEELLKLSLEESLGAELKARFHEMVRAFGQKSVLVSHNRSWNGGVHVQSCGHHMHYDCRQSYCETLKQQNRVAREQALDTDHGEFICPMCRQAANALLPVTPDPPNIPSVVFPGDLSEKMTLAAKKIRSILIDRSIHLLPGATKLRAEMSNVMEFFIMMTLPQYRLDRTNYPNQAVCQFIGSIARTNLETDLVQRGGSLVEAQGACGINSPATHTNKPKFCFVPLMHILAIHMNMNAMHMDLSEVWDLLMGVGIPQGFAETIAAAAATSGSPVNQVGLQQQQQLVVFSKDNQVPLLLQDPLTLMLHFILSLPVNIEKAYFDTIVKACFNLHMVQVFARLTCGLSRQERERLKADFVAGMDGGNSLACNLGHVIAILERTNFYHSENDVSSPPDLAGLDLPDLEKCAQELALPYLRIAALVRHYFFEADLPLVVEEAYEFPALMLFLELAVSPGGQDPKQMSVTDGINWFRRNAVSAAFSGGGGGSELEVWCYNFFPVLDYNVSVAKQLLLVNLLWKQPTLLKVPKNYDVIFQFYHKRKCRHCDSVPKDPTVCLLCGTMVCLKEACCKIQVGETSVCETVRHAQECGGGTGIFLAVNSSTIVVIRGKRACIWGSIYLDSFGEEDKELKRGKPLFLHLERYKLLEHQWITHKFDHTNRKWVMHRDAI